MNMVFDHGYLNVFSIEGPDYDTQLVAIRNLLFRQGKTDQELEKQIDAMGAVAANERAVDEWVDLLHTSIYQDAAHSMAAVGMIVPFFESMFGRLLRNMGRELDRKDLKRQGIGEKIIVHLKETGLLPYLPDGLDSTLSALCAYRNRMFHNGFEWPQKECSKFDKSIEASAWPTDWFQKATLGDDAWMFYMSPAFVEHCIQTMEELPKGLKRFQSENEETTLPVGSREGVTDVSDGCGGCM